MNIQTIPKGQVEIPAINISDKVTLNAAQTALLITDMQNDFVHPDGQLFVPSAPATVANIKLLLENARAANAPIVFMQDTHLKNDKEEALWPAHCVKDSWGWQIIDDLAPHDGELVLQKTRYDAFYGTPLEHYLKSVWGVSSLIVVGTVSNICVLHTVGSANLRWLDVVVPADGISALDEFGQALTLHQVANLYYGHIVEHCKDIQFESGG